MDCRRMRFEGAEEYYVILLYVFIHSSHYHRPYVSCCCCLVSYLHQGKEVEASSASRHIEYIGPQEKRIFAFVFAIND